MRMNQKKIPIEIPQKIDKVLLPLVIMQDDKGGQGCMEQSGDAITMKVDKEPLPPVITQEDKEELLYIEQSGEVKLLPSPKGRNIVILEPPDNNDIRTTKMCSNEDNTGYLREKIFLC